MVQRGEQEEHGWLACSGTLTSGDPCHSATSPVWSKCHVSQSFNQSDGQSNCSSIDRQSIHLVFQRVKKTSEVISQSTRHDLSKEQKKQQQQGKNKNWIFFIHQQYGTWYLGRLWRDSTSSTTYLVPSRGCDRDPVGARWENGVSLADPLKPMGGSGEALLDAPAHDTIKVPEVA